MANYKSLTDDQLWWKSQPGNRGKDVPSPEEAAAAYGRYGRQANKNVDTVSKGIDNVRKFLFKDSDARKQSVEDAVNARRDAGTSMKLEPYVKPAALKMPQRTNPRMAPYAMKNGAVDLNQPDMPEDRPQFEDAVSLNPTSDSNEKKSNGLIAGWDTLKRGGKVKATKKKLHPNW